MSKPITISPSGMEVFYKCQHQFALSRQHSLIDQAKVFDIGSMAHAIMAGDKVNEESNIYPTAAAYTSSFNNAIDKYGFKILQRELKQTFEISPGVNLLRIIDAVVEYHDEIILVDWKTAEKGTWSRVPKAKVGEDYISVSPKAMGFQAMAYLTPLPDIMCKLLGMESWPTAILFVVGNQFGAFEINGYVYNQNDDADFRLAASRMAEVIQSGYYTKTRGFACGNWGSEFACPMMAACFQTKGWQDKYKKREYSK